MEEIKLKPCPFCGGEHLYMRFVRIFSVGVETKRICCGL